MKSLPTRFRPPPRPPVLGCEGAASRLPIAALLCAAVLVGCGGTDESGTIPDQLEAFEIAGEQSYESVERQGAVTVSGSERDFHLVLEDTAGPVDLTVHTPGMTDLRSLDGRTVTVTLAPMGLHQERSVLVADEAGPLYLADVGHGVDTDALFGAGFVRYGETIGTSSDDSYDWEYAPAVFKTDDGDVSVQPGNAGSLVLGGATYRVAVIAAYKVTPHPDASLPCGGISDLLSYELLRVETAPTAAKIQRLQSAELAHLGCM